MKVRVKNEEGKPVPNQLVIARITMAADDVYPLGYYSWEVVLVVDHLVMGKGEVNEKQYNQVSSQTCPGGLTNSCFSQYLACIRWILITRYQRTNP